MVPPSRIKWKSLPPVERVSCFVGCFVGGTYDDVQHCSCSDRAGTKLGSEAGSFPFQGMPTVFEPEPDSHLRSFHDLSAPLSYPNRLRSPGHLVIQAFKEVAHAESSEGGVEALLTGSNRIKGVDGPNGASADFWRIK